MCFAHCASESEAITVHLGLWVRAAPSWVLYGGGRCRLACTQTSAATSTPAPPSICINLRLHIFPPDPRLSFAHPDIFKVCNCGRGVSTCPPPVPLFTWLHRCTQHSGHPTIAHLTQQVDASPLSRVHN